MAPENIVVYALLFIIRFPSSNIVTFKEISYYMSSFEIEREIPVISVVVPVYNTEKYLRRCIDSILAQTFTELEL